MKTTVDLWRQLEKEVQTKPKSSHFGLISRLASPDAGQRIHVGLESNDCTWVLVVEIGDALVPARSEWPKCRGLELDVIPKFKDAKALIIRLKDKRHADVFAVLANDLRHRTLREGRAKVLDEVLNGLFKWQNFLQLVNDGLSDEVYQGLWGELWVLQYHMIPLLGEREALDAWRGPEGAWQDFQADSLVVEVKTRMLHSHLSLTISHELQLDVRASKPSFLLHLELDELAIGESLYERSQAVYLGLSSLEAKGVFESKLEMCDVSFSALKMLDEKKLVLSMFEYYGISMDFPRLIPSVLPRGVSRLRYDVDLSSISGFRLLSGSDNGPIVFNQ